MKFVQLSGALLLAGVCAFTLSGCLTAREEMQMRRKPQNSVFQTPDNVSDLTEDKPAAFALWNETDHQSIHVLQLRRDAKLTQRYHREHDLTLQVVTGSAIIELEGKRHFVEAPATVVIPHLWSYAITPHKSDDKFTALAIYSPVFNGKDVILMDE